jgi:hypothetical protein
MARPVEFYQEIVRESEATIVRPEVGKTNSGGKFLVLERGQRTNANSSGRSYRAHAAVRRLCVVSREIYRLTSMTKLWIALPTVTVPVETTF